MDEQNKNLILATGLSMLVILAWFYFFPPEEPVQSTQDTSSQTIDGVPTAQSAEGTAAAPSLDGKPADTRSAALSKTKRIEIKTSRVEGSLSLLGGRIDDLRLLDYNVKLNDPSIKKRSYLPLVGQMPITRPTAGHQRTQLISNLCPQPQLHGNWSQETH